MRAQIDKAHFDLRNCGRLVRSGGTGVRLPGRTMGGVLPPENATMTEDSPDDDREYWAENAPQFKKDGELYAKVEYDHEGNPTWIQLAQNQTRRGEFNMEGSTAVYEPHDVITLRQAGEREREYVESLPFVQAVDMGDSDE